MIAKGLVRLAVQIPSRSWSTPGSLIRERIMARKLSARLAPKQRVTEQQMTAVADAGQCFCGCRADLAPAHFRVQDGRPGFALVVDGPVEEVDWEARGAREEVGDGLVGG